MRFCMMSYYPLAPSADQHPGGLGSFTMHVARKLPVVLTSLISLPGRMSRNAASSAVLAACSTSAMRPVTGSGELCSSRECAAMAMKPSMWTPRSLQA